MSKKYQNELAKMKHLMSYGLNESKTSNNSNKSILEYSQVGADGKTYGILKEGNKYYIKVAPKKHTKVLAEDFDYVGGFNNRKSYPSYTKASQELNFKLMSINEACGNKKPVKSQFNLNESADWQTPQTKETRKELNRFYQIVENVDKLLSENVHYINENDCKNGPFCEKPGDVTKKANKGGGGNKGGIGNPNQNLGLKDSAKTFTNTKGTNPSSLQSKYENGKINQDKEHKFGTNNIDSNGGNPYETKAKKTLKESPLAWPKKRSFVHTEDDLDRSNGTEIGDTAPWTQTVNECDDWGSAGVPSSAGTGDSKKYKEPFTKNTKQPVEEQFIFEVDLGDDTCDYEDGMCTCDDNGCTCDDNGCICDDNYNSEFDNNYDGKSDNMIDDYDGYIDDENQDEYDDEMLFEVTLNDFGKHPAYHKEVMSLPKTGDSSQWGRDWNDDSTKSEKPYGTQIGDSAPFEDAVNDITDAIVCQLSNKKKV